MRIFFIARQADDFRRLLEEWGRGEFRHIVEVGCCSGQHLQYLTTMLPGVESSVGIDINSQQIQRNIANPEFDPRIQFCSTDGSQWIMDHARDQTLFVTNGGVLEYFRRERLDSLLAHIERQLAPAMFFTVEPIAADHDLSTTTESIPFGEELSFSHNYRDLFEANGYRVLHQRHLDFKPWRMMTTIATT